jgi:hypothetical protein
MKNTKPFINEKVVEVPEELYPLEGSVTVPVILTPAQFDKFWQALNAEPEEDKQHSLLSTYKTRLCLVKQSQLKIDGQPFELTADPMELPDQAAAAFLVAATQECVNRASRLPTLPKPSKNGTAA